MLTFQPSCSVAFTISGLASRRHQISIFGREGNAFNAVSTSGITSFTVSYSRDGPWSTLSHRIKEVSLGQESRKISKQHKVPLKSCRWAVSAPVTYQFVTCLGSSGLA
jgi:hypothetical protein